MKLSHNRDYNTQLDIIFSQIKPHYPVVKYFFSCWPVVGQRPSNITHYCQCYWLPSTTKWKDPMVKGTMHLYHRTWRNLAYLKWKTLLNSIHRAVSGEEK